jgi:hypothetical protein
MSSPGGRSPGYDQESRQYGDYKRSPGRPPVITDWRREDRRTSDGDYKAESQSPEKARDLGPLSPPVVRPVRDILGENVVPLRISGPPKPNSGKAADASAPTQVKLLLLLMFHTVCLKCNIKTNQAFLCSA